MPSEGCNDRHEWRTWLEQADNVRLVDQQSLVGTPVACRYYRYVTRLRHAATYRSNVTRLRIPLRPLRQVHDVASTRLGLGETRREKTVAARIDELAEARRVAAERQTSIDSTMTQWLQIEGGQRVLASLQARAVEASEALLPLLPLLPLRAVEASEALLPLLPLRAVEASEALGARAAVAAVAAVAVMAAVVAAAVAAVVAAAVAAVVAAAEAQQAVVAANPWLV